MQSRRDFLTALTAFPLLAAADNVFARSDNAVRRLILDVDTGRDDIWTILGAVENFDVAAVIATYGNTSLTKALRNSLDVVMYAQRHGEHVSYEEKRMNVFSGASHPLASAPEGALLEIRRREQVNGNGICNVELERSKQRVSNESLLEKLLRRGRAVDYVACGPLTNLAALINAAEGQKAVLKDIINMVSIMGGSLDPALAVDFNFRADPEAARRVLNYFGPQIRLFPYDETKKLAVSQNELTVLKPLSPTGAFNKQVMEAYAKGWSPDGNVLLHDPATLLAFESGTRFQEERVTVATDGKLIPDAGGIAIQRFKVFPGEETDITAHILSRYMKLKAPD